SSRGAMRGTRGGTVGFTTVAISFGPFLGTRISSYLESGPNRQNFLPAGISHLRPFAASGSNTGFGTRGSKSATAHRPPAAARPSLPLRASRKQGLAPACEEIPLRPGACQGHPPSRKACSALPPKSASREPHPRKSPGAKTKIAEYEQKGSFVPELLLPQRKICLELAEPSVCNGNSSRQTKFCECNGWRSESGHAGRPRRSAYIFISGIFSIT